MPPSYTLSLVALTLSQSDRIGQTAGIDPHSGRIWFGESIRDIILQRDAEGLDSPLFFERVGSEAYFHKGNRW